MRRLLGSIVMLLVLLVPTTAHAARRYASPDGSMTSDCAVSAPCRIDRAVNGARSGDEVFVSSGEYRLYAPLKPDGGIDLHGDPDRAWPRIVAPASLKATLLTIKSGTLEHLSLQSNVEDREALVLEGGSADGVELWGNSGSGATLVGAKGGTVLRNSIVRTTAPDADAAALELDVHDGDSHVDVRNVTVMAVAGSATGIRCDVGDGSASLVNVLVRGKGADISAKSRCTAAFSNFRPAFSSGLAPGTGNQSAEPLFAGDDYRPAAGSPTIDAGALDALASSPDPDGRPRSLGSAPDIGAYEFAPAAAAPGAPSGQLPDNLQGVPLPKQGVSVLVAPARGTVRVRTPGAADFAELDEPGRIPVGSVVDARHGRVQLASAIDGGRVQAGVFWGSKFKTSQRRAGGGMTTLTLRGGSFGACRTHRAHSAMAFASRKHKRKRRSLWARDNGGRFRTHGNDSVATARGTAWLTQDRCTGTFTRVKEGAVSVRDLRRHKSVLVKAGHSYLARADR